MTTMYGFKKSNITIVEHDHNLTTLTKFLLRMYDNKTKLSNFLVKDLLFLF